MPLLLRLITGDQSSLNPRRVFEPQLLDSISKMTNLSRKKVFKSNSGIGAPSHSGNYALLEELGFSGIQTEKQMNSLLNKLTMRQLDRLKMFFLRLDSSNGSLFLEHTRRGIRENDLHSYAKAIQMLVDSQIRSKEHRRVLINNRQNHNSS